MPFELAIILDVVPENTTIAGAPLSEWEEAAEKAYVEIMGPLDRLTCPACMPHVGVVYRADDPDIVCWTHGTGMHPRCRHWAEPTTPPDAETGAPGRGPTGSDFVEQLIAEGRTEDLEAIFGPVRAMLLAGEQVTVGELWGEGKSAKTLEGMGYTRTGKPASAGKWKNAKTSRQAQAQANAMYPKIEWGISGADVDTLNPTLRALDEALMDIPQLADEIRRIRLARVPGGFAQYDSTRMMIELSKARRDFMSAPAMLAQIDELANTGRIVAAARGHVESVILHELGHPLGTVLQCDPRTRTAMLSFMAEHEATKGAIARGLSDYATESWDEALGEALVQMRLAPRAQWHPLTKRIAAMIEQLKG